MRVLRAASFGVAVASVFGRRRDRWTVNYHRRIQDSPRVVTVHTGRSGRSLLEGCQLWYVQEKPWRQLGSMTVAGGRRA